MCGGYVLTQGEEKIHISHLCAPEGNLTQFMFAESKTLYEGFLRGVKVSSESVMHENRVVVEFNVVTVLYAIPVLELALYMPMYVH